MSDENQKAELTPAEKQEIAKQTASYKLGPLYVPEGSTVVKLPPRPPAGKPMDPDEVALLQAKVFEAVKGVLPKEWEFMCCIMGPKGEKEMVGSVHGTNQNRKFLRALSDAVKTFIWKQ